MSRLRTLGLAVCTAAVLAACGVPPQPGAPSPPVPASAVTTPFDLTTPRDVAVDDPRVSGLRTVGGHAGSPVLLVVGDAGLSQQPYTDLGLLASGELRVATWELVAARDLEDAVDAIEAVRLALGTDSLHLVGHRVGALLALQYAAAHPSQVGSLTLLAPWAPTATGRIAQRAAHRRRRQRLQAAGQLDEPSGSDCAAVWRARLPAELADWTLEVDASLLPTCRDDVRRALLASLVDVEATQIAAITAPTLVVTGAAIDGDAAAADEVVSWLGSTVVDAVQLERCGALPWIECPQALFPVMGRLLSAVAAAAPGE